MVVSGRLLGLGRSRVRGVRRDAGEIRFDGSGSVGVAMHRGAVRGANGYAVSCSCPLILTGASSGRR